MPASPYSRQVPHGALGLWCIPTETDTMTGEHVGRAAEQTLGTYRDGV